MTPEDWQRVKPILAAALELDSARRSAYLQQACADSSLRDEIQSLIVAHEQAATNASGAAPLPSSLKSAANARLSLGNAGTAFRPLTAVLAFADGSYLLEGVPRMHQRPARYFL